MSRTPLPSLFGRFTAILSDHQDIGVTLRLLERMCDALERVGYTDSAELSPVSLLQRLADQLSEHFQAEEGAAYFGAIVRDRPAMHEQVRGLSADHAAMRSEVANLCVLAGDEVLSGALPGSVRRFVAHLRSHEAEETSMLREFLLSEAK